MHVISLFINIIFLFSFVNSEIVLKLAQDFFTYFFVKKIVVFGCLESYVESVNVGRSLMQCGIMFSYINISNHLKLQKILKVDYYKLGVLLDLDCPGSENVFNQFWDQHLRHNESYFWLMPTSRNSVPKYFEKLPLNIGVEMTVAIKNDSTYSLYDIYNPSYRHGGKLNITFMGSWSYQLRLNIVLTQYKYQRRGNLHGLVINSSVVVNHRPPSIDYDDYLNNPILSHLDSMHRYSYALTLQMRDLYNFTLNLSRGSTWGYLINGSFNGIIGEMVNGIVDFSTTPFQYKTERLDVIEYTVETWVTRPCFIFRHPIKNNLRNPFLKPFQMTVWYIILVFVFLNWFLLYLSAKIERHYALLSPVMTFDSEPVSETALITTAAICQQGFGEGPRLTFGRIVFIFFFVWGFLLYQFYSASIVASLLVKNPRWINTLQDLIDSDLQIGIEDMAYNHDFFATTRNSVALDLYKKKVAANKNNKKRMPFLSAAEGLKLVRKGGYAFHVDIATAYKIIEDTFDISEICDLMEVQLYPATHTYPITSKHSPFKKMITYGFRKVMEVGSGSRLLNVWRYKKPQCPESYKQTPTPVTISDFSLALFLLIFGNILSFVLMFFERMFFRRRKRRTEPIEFFDLSCNECTTIRILPPGEHSRSSATEATRLRA